MCSSGYSREKSAAFHDAVYKRDLAKAKELFCDPQVDLNWKDSKKWTPLHIACYDGDTEVVKCLLASKSLDPNLKNVYGSTPFSLACTNGCDEVVSIMLDDQRIDINKSDNCNATPFWWAASNGHLSVAEKLLASRRLKDTKTASISDVNAAQIAKREKHYTVADLIESYEKTPEKVTDELRKKLGLQDQDIGKLFALVIYFSDGYFQPKKNEKCGFLKFFYIATRLPLELQMLLCHRVFGSVETVVKTKHSEPAFQEYAKE